MEGNYVKIPYKAYIDGLRAISILSVVGFHGEIPFFGGGFIGVDIFFVISGFLITSLIVKEIDVTGSLNIIEFWNRRIRRLFPALIVVIFSTLLLSLVFLVPIGGEQTSVAKSAIASILYVSNYYFAFKHGNYFDSEAVTVPLLHTWSLSIEEQFYVVWPLLILGVFYLSKKFDFNRQYFIKLILIFIIACSFAYSCSAYFNGPSRFSFYGFQVRAWELGVGALVALILPSLRLKPMVAMALGLAGAGAVMVALVSFDATMIYPGVAAVLPVMGTAAIIISGSQQPDFALFRALSLRPLVAVGLLSYSWYLWHWPLLAIARAQSLGETDIVRDSIVIVFSLLLAAVTYWLIEKPVRHRNYFQDWSNTKTLSTAMVAVCLTVVSSSALLLWSKWLAKTPQFESLYLASSQKGWGREQCRNNHRFKELVPISDCLKGQSSDKPYLVLWGDSHADHLLGAVETAIDVSQYSPLPRWSSGCPALVGVVPDQNGQPNTYCDWFNKRVIAEIGELSVSGKVKAVVISSRWSMYLGAPALSGEPGFPLWNDGRRLVGQEAAEAIRSGLQSAIGSLEELGLQVIVVAPLPEQRFEAPHCLARLSSVEKCSVSRAAAEARRAAAHRAVENAVKDSGYANSVDLLPYLCDQSQCSVKRDGVVLFSDDEHLSYMGSRHLGRRLKQNPSWQEFLSASAGNSRL